MVTVGHVSESDVGISEGCTGQKVGNCENMKYVHFRTNAAHQQMFAFGEQVHKDILQEVKNWTVSGLHKA